MKIKICDICESRIHIEDKSYIFKVNYILYYLGYGKIEVCDECFYWMKIYIKQKRSE